MMSNLVEYKESIWKKLKVKFLSFLNMFKENNSIQQDYDKQTKQDKLGANNSKVDFKEQLQKQIKNEQAKNDILDEVERNFDLIYSFSSERLNQISDMYNERINNIKKRIEQKRILLMKRKKALFDMNIMD